jgi:hypothetical protein
MSSERSVLGREQALGRVRPQVGKGDREEQSWPDLGLVYSMVVAGTCSTARYLSPR